MRPATWPTTPAAWWLAQYGVEVELVERAPAFRDGGQNVDVRGNAREVLRRMGLEAAAFERSTKEKGTDWVTGDNRVIARFEAGNSAADNGPTAELEFSIPATPHDGEFARQYNTVGGRGAALKPARDGKLGAYVGVHMKQDGEDTWDVGRQRQFIEQQFANDGWEFPRILDALKTADDFYFDVLRQVRLPRWGAGQEADRQGFCMRFGRRRLAELSQQAVADRHGQRGQRSARHKGIPRFDGCALGRGGCTGGTNRVRFDAARQFYRDGSGVTRVSL
ncbi:hypothetical protein AB2N08_01380 [Massilia aurea]|uniref:hypothetical protein n=1 Tax=Massilia aurea TaxID=373040 RepID=UPI0034633D94